ncbi:MAG TPA: ExeM/NucH family extracellular endonuclease, partial [Pyrinomonadaceae bacterium]|nr:ExeM/NucH family extracellular endonuclease [Pyrinomonadaceae bacterium]
FDRTNSPGALTIASLNPRRYVVLDDGRSIQNPDPTPYFGPDNTRRVGDSVTGLTGVLTFDFSEYRLQPTVAPVFVSANPRTASPAAVNGTVKVSSFNVLNYFNGDGLGGGFPTSRGATTLAEFNRQRDKIIAAIVAINADVYGVIEIENDGNAATSAIQDLVNGLNNATAPGTYAFTEGTTPGTDEIKNSIIYKPATVTSDGPAVNDTDAIWTGQARNPLAQTFVLNSNGAKFGFIVNHFTSKGCSANDTGLDADQGDGQGCDNLQRTLQAEALLDFIEERQNASGEARVLVMGDLNSYGEEDPIFRLEDDASDRLADGPGGLIDLVQRLVPVAARYSYQFGNQSGYLDHALATKELDKYISGTTIWHINADEPTVLDYNLEFKSGAQQAINVGTPYRSSDHDPVIVGINLLLPTAANGVINGRITDANGLPVAGAVVNLTGTQNRKFITDANGNYRFDNVESNGFYTVRPSRVDFAFSPAERSFSQIGIQTEAAFTASPLVGVTSLLDTPEYFVRQQYLDFLGREPDESGFNFWSDQMLVCGKDPGCVEQRRVNVSAAYFLSIEFQETGGLVDSLYRASYGRAPRYSEFGADAAAVGNGVIVGKGDWSDRLAANKQAFLDAWVQRAAFRAAYDGLTNYQYVDSLVNHTGVSFSENERAAMVNSLTNGSLTRAGVLKTIAEDSRFINAKRNEMFVMMEYFGYLRRDPDQAGYQYWLNKLNQFGGNFEQAEMVRAFIVSSEYRDRFPK